MFLLTLSRVKIVFGIIIVCLLVQSFYYHDYYNLMTTRQQCVPSTKFEPKPELEPRADFSNSITMVNNKIQTNALKNNYVNLLNLALCPKILPVLNETFRLLVPTKEKLEDVALQLSQLRILEGGHQMPLDCEARHKIAILVPYKNRFSNLCSLLLNLHPFLTKQKLDYTIFVIEQFNDGPFNRGKLLNIGYTEALKFNNYECFYFHDVDLIPMNNSNFYDCSDRPKHMAVAIDKKKSRMPYSDYFGGVTSMNRTHFKLINGFSNIFWGWGAEDDDLFNRVKAHKLNYTRCPHDFGHYHSLSHDIQEKNKERQKYLELGYLRYNTDGLNSLNYQVKALKKLPLFTYILADLAEKHR
ncbi:beta-1,4-galactosyltransferase 4-like [Melanaphis sacchari]|uniref:Beta-1,4-N-acetylgalactosaminyltransferase n=1 Tax=Melanaphis sacchari TaxID=742174 RepID=A0A2H8TXG0_9HEMI|nr:beta-1,4-galactosyltransferase 4-like [Melanaphis sacchari]